MNWFEKFLALLNGQMARPEMYGWFHILSLAIMIGLIVLVCFTCRKLKYKTFKTLCITISLILILFEVYKQLNYSYNPTTDMWNYQWYAFPFQFCSTPMYVLLLVGLTRPGKFQDFLCSFLATFGLFAGIAVMLYPSTVFIETIGINIQTMVHHGLMVVVGVFMLVSGRAKLNHKTLLKAVVVFATLATIAYVGNILFYHFGNGETFNMFFISPYGVCDIPILITIQPLVPHIIFLLAYLLGFSLAAYIVLLFAMMIGKICKRKNA